MRRSEPAIIVESCISHHSQTSWSPSVNESGRLTDWGRFVRVAIALDARRLLDTKLLADLSLELYGTASGVPCKLVLPDTLGAAHFPREQSSHSAALSEETLTGGADGGVPRSFFASETTM